MKKNSREEPLKLEKVVGLTSLNGAGIVGSSTGTDMFYIAGCAIIQYNHVQKVQRAFYSTNKPIACITLSPDGRYLAAGERGHLPDIIIWDILKQERIMTLSGHKNGVGCMAFSPNQRFLVSAGFKPDKQLLVWDVSTGKRICSQRISNKVLAITFHSTGDFFVTAGDRHLKWWIIEEILEGESAVLRGTPASITEEYRLVTFTDVVCGSHGYADKVYCTTNTGVLTVFNTDKMVEKCVYVSAPLFSLEIFTAQNAPGLLILGGGNGEVYAYSPATLEKIASLPKPPPLPATYTLPASPRSPSPTNPHTPLYPACLAVRRLPGSRTDPIPKCVCVYADRGVCVYDIQDVYGAEVCVYVDGGHRGCIWSAVCVDLSSVHGHGEAGSEKSQSTPHTALFTCSADSSIKVWDIHTPSTPALLHTIHMCADGAERTMGVGMDRDTGMGMGGDGDVTVMASTTTALSATLTPHPTASQPVDYVYGFPDPELPPTPTPTPAGPNPTPLPRCLALHPLHTEIAVGDKAGCVYVYDLLTYQLKKCIHAHSAEVMTLAYSPPMMPVHTPANAPKGASVLSSPGPPPPPPMYTVWDGERENASDVAVLLASGARDRLIHIFHALDTENAYPLQDTLDAHSGSITNISFTPNGKYMVSCGSDKCMYIYTYTYTSQGIHTHIHRSINTHTHLYSMCIDPCSKFVVGAGQSRFLGIWNLNTGKLMRSYKHSAITTDLYKVTLDLSGSYIAVTGFDKRVYVLDFFSGEVLFISERGGHCELITDVSFTPNGKYLMTVGGEGGISAWKVGVTLVRGMRERLGELYASAQKKHLKATGTDVGDQAGGRSGVGSGAAGDEVVQSSLSNLKRKVSSRLSHEGHNASECHSNNSQAVHTSNSSMVSSASGNSNVSGSVNGGVRVNKWASKLGEAGGGYELFGRKVTADHTAHHNKFTLELTTPPVVEDEEERNKGNRYGQKVEEVDVGVGAVHASMSPSKVAAEEGDGVLTYLSEEDEDSGEGMFTLVDEGSEGGVLPPLKASEEVGKDGLAEEEASLVQAERKLDHLEKSAHDLENWLEAMLKSEGSSPTPMPASTSHDLGASMSAAYLRAGASKPKDRSLDTHAHTNTTHTPESRVRESKAELQRVAGRIMVMEKHEDEDDDEATAAIHVPTPTPNPFAIMPPPPPTCEQESAGVERRSGGSGSIGVVETSTTKDINNAASEGAREVDRVVQELRQKAAAFQNTLKELEVVKSKVSTSLQDLLKIRAELEKHASLDNTGVIADEELAVDSRSNNTPTNISSNDLRASLHLTSDLLGRFQRGLMSLSDMPLLQTLGVGTSGESIVMAGMSGMGKTMGSTVGSDVGGNTGSGKGDGGDDVALSLFLEKYSDKLVEIVGEKIMKQVKS